MILIKPDEVEKYMERTFESDFHGGVAITSDELLYLNKINAKNFSYRVCKEHLYTVSNGLLFQKNSYLIGAFDRIILRLHSNGLLNYWIKKYIDSSYYNVKELPQMPSKLSLNHLLGSFQIWLSGILIALFSFIFELIYFKIQNIQNSN